MPKEILAELAEACSAYAPRDKEGLTKHKLPWRTPVAQCKLALLDDPDGAMHRGILEVQVCPSLLFQGFTWSLLLPGICTGKQIATIVRAFCCSTRFQVAMPSLKLGSLMLQVYIARVREQERAGVTAFGSVFQKSERVYAKDRKTHSGVPAPRFELQRTMELLLMQNQEAKVKLCCLLCPTSLV